MTDTNFGYNNYVPYYRSTPRNYKNPKRNQWVESDDKAVYVTGFPRHVKREVFYEWLKSFGYVKRFDLPRGDGMENKGFGYVHFETAEQAKNLIEIKHLDFNNYTLNFEAYANQRSKPRMDPEVYHSMLTSQVETYAQVTSTLSVAHNNIKDIDLLSLCSSGFITEQPTQVQNSRCRSPDTSIIEHIEINEEINDEIPILAPQVSMVDTRNLSEDKVSSTPNDDLQIRSNPSSEEINKAVTDLAYSDDFKIITTPSTEPLFTLNDFDKMVDELQTKTQLSPRSQVINNLVTSILADCIARKTISEFYDIVIDHQLVSEYFLTLRNLWPTGIKSPPVPIEVM